VKVDSWPRSNSQSQQVRQREIFWELSRSHGEFVKTIKEESVKNVNADSRSSVTTFAVAAVLKHGCETVEQSNPNEVGS
jgi:hypothetical protein